MPEIIGYVRAAAGDPPSVVGNQKRLLAGSAYRPARAFLDEGHVAGQPMLKACLAALAGGDVLVATSADRLVHSVDALRILEVDLHNRGVGLVLLSFNGAVVDFRTDEAKPVLDLINELSAWHYHSLRERRLAGVARARQEGRYRGRVAVIRPDDVRQRLRAGERPSVVAREMGIARSTVYRLAGEASAGGLSG